MGRHRATSRGSWRRRRPGARTGAWCLGGARGAEVLAADGEGELALRAAGRRVARLGRVAPDATWDARRVAAGRQAFRLELDLPGTLEHLTLRACPRRPPGAHEVEIEVRAAGLNFRDVLVALGVVEQDHGGSLVLGGECAGVVTAVGPGVIGLAVGEDR